MERLQITTISWTKKTTETFRTKKNSLNQKQKKSGLRQNVLKPDFFIQAISKSSVKKFYLNTTRQNFFFPARSTISPSESKSFEVTVYFTSEITFPLTAAPFC